MATRSEAMYTRWAGVSPENRKARMRKAIAASQKSRGLRPWTAREDDFLRRAIAAYPPPQRVPYGDIGSPLGRPASAVKSRITALGIAAPLGARNQRKLSDIDCLECGTTFRPKKADQQFCSRACGDVGMWKRHPHPRGATGHHFTEEQLAKISAATKATWAAMTPDERAAQVAPMQAGGEEFHRSSGRSERTYTRGRGGRRADLDDRYFRSSWEANYARYLNWLIAHGELLTSWEYEPVTFEFPVKRGTRFYTPDFRVHLIAGGYEWHEVKGWMTQQGATALRRFALHHPAESDRLVLIDADAYRPIAASVRALIPNWE